MKQTCDICKHESGSCNRYLTEDSRTITICPNCLVNGTSYLAMAARKAHEQGRVIQESKPTALFWERLARRRFL